MNKHKIKLIALALWSISLASCASNKNNDTAVVDKEQKRQRPGGNNNQNRGERPVYSELIEKMDTDQDGLISSKEAKGPLSEIFDKVDTNSDGYISEEEFNNMTPPQRGRG